MDPLLGDAFPSNEALKCIQIGLLCVQERAVDRSTMSDVVALFGSDTTSLPVPKQPAFSAGTDHRNQESSSINDVTVTMIIL
ncbi:Receptor-like serine/threonine-protein kinase SD1-6 [Acorus gramineus]|uniref:Receptor-like serine/threonine-protein kinase SD1-6 n=1 Tax=Acorus gramineus TaxID=55184 RepID=A0AAV9BJH4_ACOGR|nr:Receptor-like serine/threonine-protein kinase SD1-6 [Acorus gramineus]